MPIASQYTVSLNYYHRRPLRFGKVENIFKYSNFHVSCLYLTRRIKALFEMPSSVLTVSVDFPEKAK